MRWLIIERLKPPHHPRQCYVLACDSDPKGLFLGIAVWKTDEPQDTAGVGVPPVKQSSPKPAVSPAIDPLGDRLGCQTCRDMVRHDVRGHLRGPMGTVFPASVSQTGQSTPYAGGGGSASIDWETYNQGLARDEHCHGPGGSAACPKCQGYTFPDRPCVPTKPARFTGRPFGTPPPTVDDDEWAGWDSDR